MNQRLKSNTNANTYGMCEWTFINRCKLICFFSFYTVMAHRMAIFTDLKQQQIRQATELPAQSARLVINSSIDIDIVSNFTWLFQNVLHWKRKWHSLLFIETCKKINRKTYLCPSIHQWTHTTGIQNNYLLLKYNCFLIWVNYSSIGSNQLVHKPYPVSEDKGIPTDNHKKELQIYSMQEDRKANSWRDHLSHRKTLAAKFQPWYYRRV